MIDTDTVAKWLYDARERNIELIRDLSEEQLLGTRLPYVQPLKWEAGHAAWFVENRVLERALGEPPFLPRGNELYDSTTIPHRVRWDLPLPDKDGTLQYLRDVREQVLGRLSHGQASDLLRYYALYGLFHEDMHNEAITYTRQHLAYPAPSLSVERVRVEEAGPYPGDVQVPGGTFHLGATPDAPFVFDNEMWAHPLEVQPFSIARAPVTQAEFAAFVDGGGYQRRDLWIEEGWQWRETAQAEHPRYWRRAGSGRNTQPPGSAASTGERGASDRWERRDFDRWVPLEPHRPVINVNWFEADAYCRWAGRRLPTELEWEVAAAGEATADGRHLATRKRRYPWGDSPPAPDRANLDWQAMGCVDVGALPAGDSAFGCRQMAGNVWEWTGTDFLPYPGFRPDEAYLEYSEPWFQGRRVLRGGCWATPSRLMWNTWRNFYPPDRGNVWAGFRTCALLPT
jgi:gamma-glutamyl hercynylcysteine S-oxide synthase